MDEQTIELKHVTEPIPPFGAQQMICPMCGRNFYVHDKKNYIYKKQVNIDRTHSKLVYVHTWTCLLILEKRLKNRDLSFLEEDPK